MSRALLSLSTFILVVVFHMLYFRLANFASYGGNDEWFTTYLKLQEFYLGFSYALSLAFATFAFMKFKECRGKAICVGLGASAWAVALWTLGCFLAGCCGSPMWLVYVNLLGISCLRLPKWSAAIMSLSLAVLGYLWLKKKLPKG